MGNAKYWWFADIEGEVYLCKNETKKNLNLTDKDYRLKVTKSKPYPAILELHSYADDEDQIKVSLFLMFCNVALISSQEYLTKPKFC